MLEDAEGNAATHRLPPTRSRMSDISRRALSSEASTATAWRANTSPASVSRSERPTRVVSAESLLDAAQMLACGGLREAESLGGCRERTSVVDLARDRQCHQLDVPKRWFRLFASIISAYRLDHKVVVVLLMQVGEGGVCSTPNAPPVRLPPRSYGRGLAISTPARSGFRSRARRARVGFHLWNTSDDIERVATALSARDSSDASSKHLRNVIVMESMSTGPRRGRHDENHEDAPRRRGHGRSPRRGATSVRMRVDIRSMRLKEGSAMSYLFISHDLAVIRQVSDRVVLHRGQVVEMSPCEQLFASPSADYSKTLLDSARNPFQGTQ